MFVKFALLVSLSFIGSPLKLGLLMQCDQVACVLTGDSSLIKTWEAFVEMNKGKKFILKGLCRNACFSAYKKAVELKQQVFITPGTVLVWSR